MDILQHIQALQFSDKTAAEALLLDFLRAHYPFDAVAVELRPLAVSLNSFNGIMALADGRRLFFKTHIESDGVIDEYYHAALLAEAGYPVLSPIYASQESGKQLLVYEIITDPSVFDLAWAIETGASDALTELTAAQNHADDLLLRLYLRSLEWQTADAAAAAPIHQLFYHRLTGGRLARFYDDTQIALPGGVEPMAAVRRVKWVINRQEYDQTLDDLIARAAALLNPAQAGASVIGHGDAHNGNLFFRGADADLMYFDPAFAGRHAPLLDLTKPLFHNVFAMWMYFPKAKAAQTPVSLKRQPDQWQIDYTYALHPVRDMFLRSKVERTLIPILLELKRRGWLRPDWRAYLKAALFCCPFLTMNLTDGDKFPPEISLLGLAMAVEMGTESAGQRSLIDRTLDDVEAALKGN
ncbi:MAG: hypothetical protein IT319_14235 [Anaerolineae bacterium]|nr:hypothetical protein [Anaerolineae bacterium]